MMGDEPGTPDYQEGAGSSLSTMGDTIGDLVSGIPSPIRKNALRAFARLRTAAVEYPVSLIENAIAEKRVASQARVKLINVSASQIAREMPTQPEYARAAATKFAHKIIRERVNIDSICDIAASELKSDTYIGEKNKEQEALQINEDWLNAFESEASQISSEQMQMLFAKILAGEIQRPTSFSIKTIRLMAQLDNEAALLFRKLCSISVSVRIPSNIVVDARAISFGSAASNSLLSYGLGFRHLNILEEYGLIISDYNSYSDYRFSVVFENAASLPFVYGKDQWVLVPKSNRLPSQELKIHGVAFSKVGREILPVVETDQDPTYTDNIKKFFDDLGLIMKKLTGAGSVSNGASDTPT